MKKKINQDYKYLQKGNKFVSKTDEKAIVTILSVNHSSNPKKATVLLREQPTNPWIISEFLDEYRFYKAFEGEHNRFEGLDVNILGGALDKELMIEAKKKEDMKKREEKKQEKVIPVKESHGLEERSIGVTKEPKPLISPVEEIKLNDPQLEAVLKLLKSAQDKKDTEVYHVTINGGKYADSEVTNLTKIAKVAEMFDVDFSEVAKEITNNPIFRPTLEQIVELFFKGLGVDEDYEDGNLDD